jgi:hypothetical protein
MVECSWGGDGMRKAFSLAVASSVICLLSFPLTLTANPVVVAVQALQKLSEECARATSGDRAGFVACLNNSAPEERDSLRAILEELSNVDTPTLRIYQPSTQICRYLDCHNIPVDTVRSLIANEIGLRSDQEKNRYTLVSTITGAASTFIAVLSLCISALTYWRAKPNLPITNRVAASMADDAA